MADADEGRPRASTGVSTTCFASSRLALTNEQIGRRMHLAPSTVKGYVEQVLMKTKSVNRIIATVFYADRHPPTRVRPG